MSECARPVSWLRLESYLLGEVTAIERQIVDEHMRSCAACRTSLDAIASDDRSLPPLPDVEPRRSWLPLGLAWAAGALALVILVWSPWKSGERGKIPPNRIAYKGGELALTLVREREGAVNEDPHLYLEGDRFSLLLTCPPGRTAWDVVVFQSGKAHFPYQPSTELACGNRTPVPGAFRLTGTGPVVVCALVGDDMPAREDLAPAGLEALGPGSVCTALDAAPQK